MSRFRFLSRSLRHASRKAKLELTFLVLCAIGGGAAGAVYTHPLMLKLWEVLSERLSGMPPSREFPINLGLPTVGLSLLGAILGTFVGNLVVDAMQFLGSRWENMDSGDRMTIVVGVMVGVITSTPFIILFNSLGASPGALLLVVLGVTLGLSSVAVYALRSIDEFLPWQRGRKAGKRRGIKILDTNVIIDGRIYDVLKAGFLEGQLYVPKFVLDELQYIADDRDPLRRQRGRRGLEILRHMQAEFALDSGTHDRLAPEIGDPVDARLVRLARALGADIVTNDFNLNRVAGLQDVKVLSINDLAMAMRTNILPRETISVHVQREGNQFNQGVGYLEDGTMVVIENGKKYINETIRVLVSQVLQTERGKMVFAEIDAFEGDDESARRKAPRSGPQR